MKNSTEVSGHYDGNYFDWQKNVGYFGGWANSDKFVRSISLTDTVIDFGCGGGFLLNNLNCAKKIGLEPNPTAGKSVSNLGILHFTSAQEAIEKIGPEIADIIISNNALEHTLNPLQELKNLRPLLKKNGLIHFVVPCESIKWKYNPKDINYHLYSWSPQSLGNLFTEAGFQVEYCRPYMHKWPPYYTHFGRLGRPIFNLVCRVYARIERSWFQVEVKARKV